MDVDFDDLIVVHYHDAVTDGFQRSAQVSRIVFTVRVTSDDKFRAIGEMDFLVKFGGHIAEEFSRFIQLFFFGFYFFYNDPVAQYAEDAVKNHAQALSTGVDDTGFFQYRQ